jgi:peptidoglycan/LPS O-acetylase OafA/YrhL
LIKPEKDHVYFPNLNGLRFFAAFMVLYAHVKFFKHLYGVNEFKFPINTEWGELGVTLFFVLSGFLITYLLLHEYAKFGTIQLRFFYMRRVLRIFPLYYLTVILAFFVLPHFLKIPHFSEYNPLFPNSENVDLTASADPQYYKKLGLFSVFLPNLSYVTYDLVPFGSQLWSVGVEEQFYLFWPTLLLLFHRRLFPVLLIIAGVIALSPFFISQFIDLSIHPKLMILDKFLYFLRIDSMAIGGIMAYLLFKKKTSFLNFIYQKWFQWLVLILLLYGLLFNVTLTYFHNQVYSVFFAILILNLASNPNPIISLEHRVFKYLGKISYGLYIYNPLAIVLSINLCNILFGAETLVYNVILFIASVLLTVILSSVSYHFFEEKFLALKPKFSKILSN